MASSLRWLRPLRVLPVVLSLALIAEGLAPGAFAQGAAGGSSRNNLPALGDSASDDISVANERRIGDRIMRDIRRDRDYLDDPALLEYVQGMWSRLLAASRERGNIPSEFDERFAWEPFLVRDRTVNAFALPGGFIGVHLGLIAITATPDELASVLAHELSHVTQRHIARSVGASKTTSLVGIAGLILGVLAASRSPDAANALITGSQAVSVQSQLNYSRDAEREADRVGFNVLTSAGYAPGGMAAMFEKLLQASRLNDNQNYPYLRSHPLTTERIGEARSRLGVATAGALPRPLLHALMQARARVMMDPRDGALQRAQDFDSEQALGAAATPADRLAALYGSALASTLRRDFARADVALATARPLAQGEAEAAGALAQLQLESLLARGDAARAATLLQTLQAAPGGHESRPLLVAQAQLALLPGSRPESQRVAVERLQTWVAVRRQDALVWGQAAQLWERQGQRLRAVRADAESRAALGDLQGAVDRLRAAQKLARTTTGSDFIEASVLEARLRELEVQRRQATAEERGEAP